MLPIKPSKTKNSSIVAMGQKLSDAMKKSGEEYLMLNRGICSVVNINLNPIVESIDFNSDTIQYYPGTIGKVKLRNAINTEYFNNKADTKNILVTGGGISGLDITFQNLNIDEVLLPKFFWGTYVQLLNLRGINYSSYENYPSLLKSSLNGKAVIVCDPGNPLGEKSNDEELLYTIKELNSAGAAVIIDCPYRRLFFDKSDTFFQKLLAFENVIIIESFSKSLGLSGQRIGFIHCSDKSFIGEASLRLSFAANGINSFAQTLVSKLLYSPEGKKAVSDFKAATIADTKKNIEFLEQNNLLATQFYENSNPLGIFAVVNKSVDELYEHRIGSVGLNYFTLNPRNEYESFSRILVAFPHEKFVSFFRTLNKQS